MNNWYKMEEIQYPYGLKRANLIQRARQACIEDIFEDDARIAVFLGITGDIEAVAVAGHCGYTIMTIDGTLIVGDPRFSRKEIESAFFRAEFYCPKKNTDSRLFASGKYGRGHWEGIVNVIAKEGDDEFVEGYILLFDEQGTEICSYEFVENGEIIAIEGKPDENLSQTKAEVKKIPLGENLVRVFAEFCEKWEKEH